MRLIFGIIALLLGLVTLLWIGYNLLIEMQPEAEGRNPWPVLALSLAEIYVGIVWIRGKSMEEDE